MVRREAQRLDDIADAISEIRRFTAGMEAKAYLADRQVQQAVAWALIIIGEAIKLCRQTYGGVMKPWHGPSGPVCAISWFISTSGSISAEFGGSSSVIFRRSRLP